MAATRRVLLTCVVVITAGGGVAGAWHGPGHDRATRLALSAAGADLPAMLAKGAGTIAHCSADPDLFRLRAHAQLRDAEVPEHFIDLELLGDAALPPTRSAFVELCAKKGLKPSEVGFVPYAVVEWTQRLTIALAEHRKWPDNPHIRLKCLVYAGILCHYAQDACQPLHTTIHYDGKANKDGTSPRTGIHAKVDALLQKVAPRPGRKVIKAVVYKDLFAPVAAEVGSSHRLVGRVYEIEKHLPAPAEALAAGSPAAAFAAERLDACAAFTASLFLTAWKASAKVELPQWHQRPLGRRGPRHAPLAAASAPSSQQGQGGAAAPQACSAGRGGVSIGP